MPKSPRGKPIASRQRGSARAKKKGALDANGVMVRIQKVDAVTPVAYTTLGWKVRDIRATIRRLDANGVRCERFAGLRQDDLGVWRSPGGGRTHGSGTPKATSCPSRSFEGASRSKDR
jgi:hypothetical protein